MYNDGRPCTVGVRWTFPPDLDAQGIVQIWRAGTDTLVWEMAVQARAFPNRYSFGEPVYGELEVRTIGNLTAKLIPA